MATSLSVLSMQKSRILLLLYLSVSVDSISLRFRQDEITENNKFFQEDVVLSPDSSVHVTHAIYKGVVPIWDSKTRKLTDFSTHFTFTADTRHATRDDGGITFFLAPIGFQIPPNSEGGFLGLYNKLFTSDSSKPQIVHVEFDTGINGWDPSFEHVGINVNSLTSSNYTRWYSSSHSGDIADVWISYDSMTKNLSVSWQYLITSTSSEKTFLSYHIDLKEVLPQQAIVGFSAATSVYLERPSLLSWDFNSSLDIEQTSKSNGNKVKVNVGVRLTVLVGLVLIIAAII